MGNQLAAVRFDDWTIMFTNYQDTADVLGENLLDYVPELDDPALFEDRRPCTCNRNVVDIGIAATWGMSWLVKVCRRCNVVLEGRSPYGLYGWGGATISPPSKIEKEPGWFRQVLLERRGS